MHCLEMKLPPDIRYFQIAMSFVRGCAEDFGFRGESALKDIELASEEAISNVITHSCPTDPESAFIIVCQKIPSGMEITIRDRGIPFDPDRIAVYDPEKISASEELRGLGIFLMRKIMDRVTYLNLGREGKELRLVKYLERRAPEGMRELSEGERPSPLDLMKNRKRTGYEVRMFEPRDAVEVSRCAYLMHGYTFYDEDVYYPETLTALHESGKMVAAVAVTPEGEIALFNALIRREPDAAIAEMTYVLVNPRIRAPGAMERVGLFLMKGQGHWLKGVTASIAASHTLTQNLVIKHGFIPCSIYLSVDAADWKFHFLRHEDQAGETISNVNFFKFLQSPAEEVLYPPDRHREMIETLYGWLGVRPAWGEPSHVEPPSPDEPARLEAQTMEGEENAQLTVMKFGADLIRRIESFVRECRQQNIRFLELRLPLSQPSTATHTGRLEEIGFFFSGVLPMGRYGDYLIMQMPLEWDIHYDSIKVASANSLHLLSYIRECERRRHESE